LNDAEKANLLSHHAQSMDGIEKMLENDRKKQENELDAALRNRIANRRKKKELQNKKDIAAEMKKAEEELNKEAEQRKKQEAEKIKAETDAKLKEVIENGVGDDGNVDQSAIKDKMEEVKKQAANEQKMKEKLIQAEKERKM
jgi:hypothetical protein